MIYRILNSHTDEQLARINWSVVDLTEWPEDELKRVLWMAASGLMFLPQTAGETIDEEIKQRPIRAAELRAFWEDEFEAEMES